ncbi:hypothetical protein GCK32_011347, partial [Trichostrongylus colubriformis]
KSRRSDSSLSTGLLATERKAKSAEKKGHSSSAERNSKISLTKKPQEGTQETKSKHSLVRKASSTGVWSQRSGDDADASLEEPFKDIDRTLTTYQWFHGMMPREDCEEMVKNEGDFLIRRTTIGKTPTYCITVRHNNEIKHIPIMHTKGIWSLNKECKPTLAELVDVYVKEKRSIPPSNSVLLHEIPRPDYYVLHKDIILGKQLGRSKNLDEEFPAGVRNPTSLGGAFGEVYSGKLKLSSGEVEVAVKRAKEKTLKKAQLASFIREARIMRRLDHPNIVRMYGVAPQEEPVMILLELAVGGSLKEPDKRADFTELLRVLAPDEPLPSPSKSNGLINPLSGLKVKA